MARAGETMRPGTVGGGRSRHLVEPSNPPSDAGTARLARPRPGGKRASPAAAASVPADGLQTLAGTRPADANAPSLITPAMPLLQLMARLRTMATQPDVADLRTRSEAEIGAFDARAAKAGVGADQLRRASYALCASLDDLVLNTPWGARGAWADQPLVASFHAAVGPDRFFDLLRQAQEKGPAFRPVLELMYLCLSLGMMGQFRRLPQGAAEIETFRAQTATLLASQVPPPAPDLAAHWRGLAAPFRPRRTRLPVWVAASLAVAAVGAVFLLLSLRLNDQSDGLFARMLVAAPSHMPVVTRQALAAPPPPAPPPAEPSAQDRLRARLAQTAPAVVVAGTPTTPILRIPDEALFAADAAVLQAGAKPLLDAVAAALKPEAGALQVVGYADNRPVRTVLFPSSFRLSAAQAQAVRAALGAALADPKRVRAEGRASANPVADNATAEGREQNRRVEIALEGAAP